MKLTCATTAVSWALLSNISAADGNEKQKTDHTKVYERPSTEGLHWAETFDGDVWSHWIKSDSEKFNGEFSVSRRKEEALEGDVGLLAALEAKKYGVSVSFPPITGEAGTPFIVQYEARFQDGLTCGGSYVKLFDRSSLEVKDFDAETPYVIMFGPDRCGATDKVHFILKHKNPHSGLWDEKHFKEAPPVPHDKKTHLYGLVINPDNSFEIQIDGATKASGDLLTSMEPPVNPPKEIDDPEDSKPEDWVDEMKMADPESFKPDDWDEEEPMHIPDPSSSMPSGWLEGEEKRIADPEAKIPHDWDEEEDGEWEAPIIDNPLCAVGCGKWEAPKISNPAYKGKWNPEMITNPDYKGLWKPKQIANPHYFEDKQPCVLPTIDSIGIDIWTMQGGILFDNFIVSTDIAKAKAFADVTFQARKAIEELQTPSKSSGGIFGGVTDWVMDHPIPTGATALVILISLVWFCFLRSDNSGSDTPEPRRVQKNEERSGEGKTATEKEDKEEEDREEEEQEDKETENEEKEELKEQEKGEKEAEEGPKNRKKKGTQGGLGMAEDDS